MEKKNEGEWTGKVEIRKKEDIPGIAQSIHSHIQTYYRLQRENVSSRFSTDGTLLSVPTVHRCEAETLETLCSSVKGL